MNPLDARESEETYEYPARPYTLPMRPVQSFRVLSTSGDTPTWEQIEDKTEVHAADWSYGVTPEDQLMDEMGTRDEAWSDKYLTAEDARVLRQDGI